MQRDLCKGNILQAMLLFALPMMAGNLLQQIYNIADTLIVGRCLGSDALAAVGSSYTLMTFLTSVVIGNCMGCGALFGIDFGAGHLGEMKKKIWMSFCYIMTVTALIVFLMFAGTDPILHLLQVPEEIYGMMRGYVRIIFAGILFVTLYNFFAYLLRATGNSAVPLYFLAFSSILNIVLDLWFVLGLHRGVVGTAEATVIAQAVSGIGIAGYTLLIDQKLRVERSHMCLNKKTLAEIIRYSCLTCLQQSVMNFGILMIQGLVNSFGTTIMAAFAAAVKIDTIAYMPAQEFGNACSMFISQNYGAGKNDRIRKGTRLAVRISVLFCAASSLIVCGLARLLMQIFVDGSKQEILDAGVRYLRIEGAFYWGIGCLFLLYGLYRGIGRPGMSLVLTVISLGTRVALAYLLAPNPAFGVTAIWWAIPAGWILADLAGYLYYVIRCRSSINESGNLSP
ncbi:MAG: MATE family efflux transporter [Lachnospiraceae bacterium]|nr:MATE family efflux transporter [Lachnospiraceae bacterium]